MGANLTTCCFRYYVRPSREEMHDILRMRNPATPRPPAQLSSDTSESSESDTEEESLFKPVALRHNPGGSKQQKQSYTGSSPSATGQGLDRELQAFISMRDQADQATEEWEKLNYDIHVLRYAQREVKSRWRKILVQLGYQCEVESLLCVNRQSRFSRDLENLKTASHLLQQLLDHTSLFPPGTGDPNRYLFVMDRLLSLDSAEDFVRLAKDKYPK
ncbi:melanoregulin-like [Gouania willdenowi]|uniref:melanoregulin-like n=1 Tax=Gouania willdenowi TaxID=441366 RepID=UPI0010543285|nr:melanoregulin-like [Gouania willdenowi]